MIASLQDAAWKRLVALRARLPHALLLHGAAGSGKLALAERFAQALLCEAAPAQPAPCGRCDACRWFAADAHPDLRRVEPETSARQPAFAEEEEEGKREPARAKAPRPGREIRVEQIRALADFINVASHRGGLRIALLHPAEEMNAAAANALLKSLEEPPAGAVFLLVSNRPWRLPVTVRSRCVAVAVPLPDRAAALDWLAQHGVTDPERWLDFAGGAPRRAVELARGEQRALIETFIGRLEAGALKGAVPADDRETVDLLAEAMQRFALDRAFCASGGRAKYFPLCEAGGSTRPRQWLAFARRIGEYRQLVRHPLNPKLFAEELLAMVPDD